MLVMVPQRIPQKLSASDILPRVPRNEWLQVQDC
uniref:Uncharacterized protein n=1 Tax=Arundo donax TaxID=35708 RepID=A0A0A8XPC5_ARUDO